jgi:hypothetical protein
MSKLGFKTGKFLIHGIIVVTLKIKMTNLAKNNPR